MCIGSEKAHGSQDVSQAWTTAEFEYNLVYKKNEGRYQRYLAEVKRRARDDNSFTGGEAAR